MNLSDQSVSEPIDLVQAAAGSADSADSGRGHETVTPNAALDSQTPILRQIPELGGGRGLSGYVGAVAAVSWLRAACNVICDSTDLIVNAVHTQQADDARNEVHALSANFDYYADEEDLLYVSENLLDQYVLPARQDAFRLSDAFFSSIEGLWAFVSRDSFLANLQATCYSDTHHIATVSSPDKRSFLGLCQMIWAVAAKLQQVTNVLFDRDLPVSGEHLLFYARARGFGFDHRISCDTPDVVYIQGLGVLSLYLLLNGSIHR